MVKDSEGKINIVKLTSPNIASNFMKDISVRFQQLTAEWGKNASP